MVARQTSMPESGGCGFESHVGCFDRTWSSFSFFLSHLCFRVVCVQRQYSRCEYRKVVESLLDFVQRSCKRNCGESQSRCIRALDWAMDFWRGERNRQNRTSIGNKRSKAESLPNYAIHAIVAIKNTFFGYAKRGVIVILSSRSIDRGHRKVISFNASCVQSSSSLLISV